jgi:hypothetical protein
MSAARNGIGRALAASVLVLGACKSHPPGSLEALRYEARKHIYLACIKSSVHDQPQMAIHMDMGEVSAGCHRLARRLVERQTQPR